MEPVEHVTDKRVSPVRQKPQPDSPSTNSPAQKSPTGLADVGAMDTWLDPIELGKRMYVQAVSDLMVPDDTYIVRCLFMSQNVLGFDGRCLCRLDRHRQHIYGRHHMTRP